MLQGLFGNPSPAQQPASPQGGGILSKPNLLAFGTGMLSDNSPDAFASGMANVGRMAGHRQEENQKLQQVAQVENKTADWLIQNGADPERVNGARGIPGALSTMFQQAMKPKQPAKLPTSVQEWQVAKGQGFEGNLADWKTMGKPETTINVGDGGASGSFYKEAGKQQAQAVAGMAQAGNSARRNLARIQQLEGALGGIESGGAAQLKQIAGNLGIPTEGLDDIQAAQALINQLVPEQRQPGSGPMSDKDLELFKQALPRIINQPGGNAKIIGMMRGIAEYDVQIGEIANQVLMGQISPEQGQAAMSKVPNPLAEMGQMTAPAASPSAPPQAGAVMDGYTFRGGDPADPSNWVSGGI